MTPLAVESPSPTLSSSSTLEELAQRGITGQWEGLAARTSPDGRGWFWDTALRPTGDSEQEE